MNNTALLALLIRQAQHSHLYNSELEIKDYEELKITIESYTKGLKSRIKELAIQTNLCGFIEKKIYSEVDEIHNTPIYTEAILGGRRGDLDELSSIIKEVVEDSVELEVKPCHEHILSENDKKGVIIMKTMVNIANRRNSDAGEEKNGDEGVVDQVVEQTVLVANQMKNKAKRVLNVVSDIPILSEYTNDLKEKWSLLVKEQPKTLISAKSLFHPFSVYSFQLYLDDNPNVFKPFLLSSLQKLMPSFNLSLKFPVVLSESFDSDIIPSL